MFSVFCIQYARKMLLETSLAKENRAAFTALKSLSDESGFCFFLGFLCFRDYIVSKFSMKFFVMVEFKFE